MWWRKRYKIDNGFDDGFKLHNRLVDDCRSRIVCRKFFGSVLRKLGAVPINRGEADIASIKSALTLLKDGKIFTLFPEGTRNKAGETDADMLQIKNGLAMLAIKSQSPIRAALFYRKPKVFRRNYLIIGDEFSLETFYGQKISADVLSEASKIIEQKFDELREKFDALLTEKGVKKIENPSA